MRSVKVRIVLDDGCHVLSKDLIVGAVHELFLVWLAINCALAVAVMDRQAVDSMCVQHL